MDEQKIFFANIFSLLEALKGEYDELKKADKRFLFQMPWDSTSILANEIIGMGQRIQGIGTRITKEATLFLMGGPYDGEAPGVTPLEAAAETTEVEI